jgi:hypothetical protein
LSILKEEIPSLRGGKPCGFCDPKLPKKRFFGSEGEEKREEGVPGSKKLVRVVNIGCGKVSSEGIGR